MMKVRFKIFTLVLIECKETLQANICMTMELFLILKNKLISPSFEGETPWLQQ